MEGEASYPAPDLLRSVTAPVGLAVVAGVAAAWYVTWATADAAQAVMAAHAPVDVPQLAATFVLLVVMMVAMMLPSALPMILAYRGLTRLEAGVPAKPADRVATALFVAPYVVVWGAFGLAALLGLMVLGTVDPFMGALAFLPAATLLAAGGYQITRTKEVCLRSCQSPMGFVMHHWRGGRVGAVRMGLRHAAYCLGCCWLFMIALFVAGSMSLLWMGVLALAIFGEKVGTKQLLFSRVVGVVLLALGGLVALRTLVPG